MTVQPQFPAEQSAEGEFERQEDAFRDWVSADGSTPFPAASGRYHLYVSLACPWASRSLIVRNLSGLQEAIGVTVVDPIRDERGWAFRDGPGYSRDPVNNFAFLSEAYRLSASHFDGRVTVPVLWDKETRRIVSNSEVNADARWSYSDLARKGRIYTNGERCFSILAEPAHT